MVREWFDIEYLLIDDWLAVATKGLSEESATRVAEEIQEHYNESVAALIAEGYRPGGAELETIKRLGSPFRARRHYRHEYPTQSDMKMFHQYQEDLEHYRTLGLRLSWCEMYGVGCIFFAAFLYFGVGISGPTWSVLITGFGFLMNGVQLRIAARVTTRRGIRDGYETHQRGTFALVWLFLVFGGFWAYIAEVLVPFLLIPIFYLFLSLRTVRWWRKIRPFLCE